MQQKIVAFQDVKPGDKVFVSSFYALDKWRTVTETKGPSEKGTISLFLGVSALSHIDTRTQVCGHARQAITVKTKE